MKTKYLGLQFLPIEPLNVCVGSSREGGRGKEGETENRVGTLASREEGMIYTLGDKRAPRSMKSTIRVVLGSVLVTGRWPVPKLRAFVCVKGRQIDKSIAL